MKYPILDLETTGLIVNPGAILEVAVLIADTDYQVHEEYTKVVKHDMNELDPKLNPWAAKAHFESGLLTECVTTGTDLEVIESEVLALLDRHFTPIERPLLTGNSIHFDRDFIKAYMPRLDKRLHYRMMDISGLWEHSKLFKGVNRPEIGEVAHRALADVKGSLKLLQAYGK